LKNNENITRKLEQFRVHRRKNLEGQMGYSTVEVKNELALAR